MPDNESHPKVPVGVHLLAGLLVVGSLLLSRVAPALYERAMQEDRPVEWATSITFGIAGFLGLVRSFRTRRIFDGLVALFCVFVAGEEVSWGQRLLGFTPPTPFLEHNTQQEFNLHNFAELFGRPKQMLMLALVGYGLLLPTVGRWPIGVRWLWRIGATSPALALAPWFAVAVFLLAWYPVNFTGEWVELLAGLLFLSAITPDPAALARLLAAVIPLSFLLTWASARSGGASHAEIACAQKEVDALLLDLTSPGTTTGRFERSRSIHKRLQGAVGDGYVDASRLLRFGEVACEQSRGIPLQRREHGVDPWGTAYWIALARDATRGARVTVYSFGPNRRRDFDPHQTGSSSGRPGPVATGDDIVATTGFRP